MHFFYSLLISFFFGFLYAFMLMSAIFIGTGQILKNGFWGGMYAGIGSGLAMSIYAFLAFFGVSIVYGFLAINHIPFFRLTIGGILLLWGLFMLFYQPKKINKVSQKINGFVEFFLNLSSRKKKPKKSIRCFFSKDNFTKILPTFLLTIYTPQKLFILAGGFMAFNLYNPEKIVFSTLLSAMVGVGVFVWWFVFTFLFLNYGEKISFIKKIKIKLSIKKDSNKKSIFQSKGFEKIHYFAEILVVFLGSYLIVTSLFVFMK